MFLLCLLQQLLQRYGYLCIYTLLYESLTITKLGVNSTPNIFISSFNIQMLFRSSIMFKEQLKDTKYP